MDCQYIPTVTGKHKKHLKYPVALCSPSKNSPLVEGVDQTIADCHTFYLRILRNTQLALEHYLWYCDWVNENRWRSNLVFVTPDCDWLPKDLSVLIEAKWIHLNTEANCLAVPSSPVAAFCNIVGIALTKRCPVKVHPEWTHIFGGRSIDLPNPTRRFTYDALSPIC